MKYTFEPKSGLEKFGVKVHDLLVENFPRTFFVGGMVRDMLLRRKIADIDIATEATPIQAKKVLRDNGVIYDDSNQMFGNLIAKSGQLSIEITTLRKDLKSQNRYPKVVFINDPKIDSQRRDFTINALYFRPKTREILDFHNGLKDLKDRKIRFIGDPETRIKEDPLRVIRALRFVLVLDFEMENKTSHAIQNNFDAIKLLTKSRVGTEIKKIQTNAQRKKLEAVINSKKPLDSILKKT